MLLYGQTTIANSSLHLSVYVSQGTFGIAEDDRQQIKDFPASLYKMVTLSLSRKSLLGNCLIFDHHEQYSLHV